MKHRLVLIRHAEEPDSDSDRGLSWRGRSRRAALAWAMCDPGGLLAGEVPCLIAASDNDDSCRPRLTVEPLGTVMTRQVHTVDDADFAGVSSLVPSHPGHCLIC
ncbi:hypothetical protein [Tahibacter amnicola]|uniref:Histidine phosphatase superfamily protein (Branch 1) n=1 Tax=Tahibacter amnicola TaxID=2976241 RepID=A0ABY6BBM4_9GAMM|nr:hypothetical protein [Tahibacter amnicola]UXI66553.1 hypothetical protein N4264_17595 [Tahibacter amnicola]